MTTTTSAAPAAIQELPLADIYPGANDRTVFDPAKIDELAASIKEHGLAQPIIVRPGTNGGYQIVAGERRFRAASKLEWWTIPAIVRDLSNQTASAIMLAENVARADLDVIDEALAYRKRMDDFGWTEAEMAKRAGIPATRIRERLPLLLLEPTVRDLTRKGHLPLCYAQAMVAARLSAPAQISAMKIFNNEPRPTLGWFASIVSCLAERAQESMFDDFELSIMQAQDDAKAGAKAAQNALPLPLKTKAPTEGATLREILVGQIAFWQDAERRWGLLKKAWNAWECRTAAKTLQDTLAIIDRLDPAGVPDLVMSLPM